MHRANLFSHTDDFTDALKALNVARALKRGDYNTNPVAVYVSDKCYTVSITDTGTWRVIEG